MKKIIYPLILVFIFCSISIAQAGGDPVKKFYRKHKHKDHVFNITLPEVLTRTCVGIARIFTKDEEAKEGLKLAKKMKGIRVLVDNGNQVAKAAGKELIRDLESKGHMERLISVRENGSHIVIMGQIKGEKIKKIVVVTFAEGQFTMVAAKSRLKIKHVNQLIKVLQKKQEKGQNQKEKETKILVPRA